MIPTCSHLSARRDASPTDEKAAGCCASPLALPNWLPIGYQQRPRRRNKKAGKNPGFLFFAKFLVNQGVRNLKFGRDGRI